MRVLPLFVIASACLIISVRADLTIVQRVEGGAQNGDVTVKIKGDKERMDAASQPTRIIDGKAGEMLDLMNDKKTFVRISATQMKAAAETMQRLDSSKPGTSTPKLRPTGKKETISGYETEEYVYETADFKAHFWVATKYPGADAILRQLQAPMTGAWRPSNMGVPDYTDFPGLPLKTVISGKDGEVTTTIISIKQDPLSDAEFAIPSDFQESKRPLPSLSPSSENSPQASPSSTS